MQFVSAFLGVTAFICAFTAISSIFRSDKSNPFSSRLKFSGCMVLIAASLFGLKLYVVDNYAEVDDSEYRSLYLISKEVGRDDFNALIRTALEDGKFSKNEYREIKSQVDTKYMDIDTNKVLNISDQVFTPLQLKPIQRMSVMLSVGLGAQATYLGLIISAILLIAALFKFKRPSEEEIKEFEKSPNKALLKAFRLELRKSPEKLLFIFGFGLFVASGGMIYSSLNQGSVYKKEIDQFFEANSNIKAVHELKPKIYANDKISMSEVSSLISLAETIEKKDIIKALK